MVLKKSTPKWYSSLPANPHKGVTPNLSPTKLKKLQTNILLGKLEWDRSCALILRGPAETGKTSWAIHQFNKPLKIEDLDELKDLPVDCDGVLFDEMIFDERCKKNNGLFLGYGI